jgi:hypothetical protein
MPAMGAQLCARQYWRPLDILLVFVHNVTICRV